MHWLLATQTSPPPSVCDFNAKGEVLHPSHLTAPDLPVIPVFLTILLPITSHMHTHMQGQQACDLPQHQSQLSHSSSAEIDT